MLTIVGPLSQHSETGDTFYVGGTIPQTRTRKFRFCPTMSTIYGPFVDHPSRMERLWYPKLSHRV
uniref:Uncharacterized protein n=1 Tax=Lepeophtheirus salmonis TaxID=72036 RepID=A0A0K2UNQ9_LEPSM